MININAQVDCRVHNAQEVVTAVLPLCLEARSTGTRVVILLENLELLADSVARLLKAFDRLAEDLGSRFALSDRSGLAKVFFEALSVNGHLEFSALN